MNLNTINNVYFLGIGGIGMSALARYFNALGKSVGGYDKTSTALTNQLAEEGIHIHFEDDVEAIPENFKSQTTDTLIVYTPAVPADHSELNYFKDNNFEVLKRAQLLGVITKNFHTIAVAGTHGKTTTSSMIAHILTVAEQNPSAFLGGITQNYNNNLLLGKSENSSVIVEADEYDKSFLNLHPALGVITSVDSDHLDIYDDSSNLQKTYSEFADLVEDQLILNKEIENDIERKSNVLTYSLKDSSAHYYAQNIQIKNAAYHYDVVTPNTVLKNLTLGLPGYHNVENSVAAIAIAELMKVSEAKISESLKSFKGVKRRFEYHVKTDEQVYIDDYAHHPSELKACINSVKEMYPGKKVTGIFQPHLYSRTRDFAEDFATSLDLLDVCILLDIYPARELPIEGVDSKMLLEKMKLDKKQVCSKVDLLDTLKNKNIEVLLTLGAGDIDTLVEPIKQQLIN